MIVCRDRRDENSRARLMWGGRGLVPSKRLALLIQPGKVLESWSPPCTYTSHCLYQCCSTRNLDQTGKRVSSGYLGLILPLLKVIRLKASTHCKSKRQVAYTPKLTMLCQLSQLKKIPPRIPHTHIHHSII